MKNFRFCFAVFFLFSDFVNSDDCIGKSHQNLSEYNQFLLKKRFEVDGEKMRNSGNFFTIMLTRSSERIFYPMRYTGLIVHKCLPV